jgi:hypothetical protein
LKKIRNGKFTFVPFSNDLQVAPINVLWNLILIPTKRICFAAGNYFGCLLHSRFDGFLELW